MIPRTWNIHGLKLFNDIYKIGVSGGIYYTDMLS